MKTFKTLVLTLMCVSTASTTTTLAAADLPAFDKVSEGYEKVIVADPQNPKGLFNLWQRKKDSQLLGEIPKNFAGKSYFIALTVSSGDRYAGLQSGDWVVQWRKYDDRLAMIAPELERSRHRRRRSQGIGETAVHRPSAVGRPDRRHRSDRRSRH